MKTLEELKEKHEKQIAQFHAEQQIRAELTEELHEASICFHSGFASVIVHEYQADKQYTLPKALSLVRSLKDKIVNGEHWKDGSVSTWPAAINSNAKREHATLDGSHAVEIKVDGGKGYAPNVAIEFWVQLDSSLVEVSVYVRDLWKLVPSVHCTYYQGEVASAKVDWPVESRCVDSFRKWWSTPGGYSGSYYLADIPNFESWASSQIAPALHREAVTA